MATEIEKLKYTLAQAAKLITEAQRRLDALEHAQPSSLSWSEFIEYLKRTDSDLYEYARQLDVKLFGDGILKAIGPAVVCNYLTFCTARLKTALREFNGDDYAIRLTPAS